MGQGTHSTRAWGGNTATGQGTQSTRTQVGTGPNTVQKHLLGLQVKLEKAYWDYQLLVDLEVVQKRAKWCKFRVP